MEIIVRPESMQRITTPELAQAFINEQIDLIRKQVGDKKVLLALSGGVDSSVVAALLIKAIGKQLVCVHVNHGLMRKGESENVLEVFRNQMDANLVYVDATDRFLTLLEGVAEPEQKRKVIGNEFINVFAEEARKEDDIAFLAQGTIYPDILESKGVKAHHNVGGLPDDLKDKFELVEPLALLYKDEVRVVGVALGLPAEMVWQYFIAVPDFTSVGVRDGKRYMGWPAIIRAVNTTDAMTATIEEVPYAVLHKITNRITAEVEGINRVLMDLTPKPVGTIEWE